MLPIIWILKGNNVASDVSDRLKQAIKIIPTIYCMHIFLRVYCIIAMVNVEQFQWFSCRIVPTCISAVNGNDVVNDLLERLQMTD
jgi:hypothetical protein